MPMKWRGKTFGSAIPSRWNEPAMSFPRLPSGFPSRVRSAPILFACRITVPFVDQSVGREGAYYYCTGQLVCGAIEGRVEHFASKHALNIEGLGKENRGTAG